MKCISRIKRVLNMLLRNPMVFFGKLVARLKNLMPIPKRPVCKRINGVLFNFDFDLDPVIARMYRNDYEYESLRVIRRFLVEGDTFIDVGANIGYISAIAAGCVGRTGEVHSFEPVPRFFQMLKKMAEMNKQFKIIVNQCALGENKAIANIDVTNRPNIGWNTMVPGHMSSGTRSYSIEVPVLRLDDYIIDNKLSKIAMVKIDTEGYEFPILKGLSKCFDNAELRPYILCEVGPSPYPLLGLRLQDLLDYMEGYSYHAFSIYSNCRLRCDDLQETTNVLFKPF